MEKLRIDTSKVSRAALRAMRVGQTVTFGPMTGAMLFSGRSNVYSAQYVLGCRFKTSTDFTKGTLRVRKEACNG